MGMVGEPWEETGAPVMHRGRKDRVAMHSRNGDLSLSPAPLANEVCVLCALCPLRPEQAQD